MDRLVLDMEGHSIPVIRHRPAGDSGGQKQMNEQGTMTVRNVCGTIMEVFGHKFYGYLTIE